MVNVNKVLRVNNTMFDNELDGTDMTLKIIIGNPQWRTPRDFLNMEDKQLCAVRWSRSFLSSFGEYWSGQIYNPDVCKI